VECRADDPDTLALLGAIEHAPSRRVVDAERAFLGELGGDCSLPAGAHAVLGGNADGGVVLDALLASADGHVVLRHRVHGEEPAAVGARAARGLLERGGAALLDP
jgi:hydroxymethylbilane synthase